MAKIIGIENKGNYHLVKIEFEDDQEFDGIKEEPGKGQVKDYKVWDSEFLHLKEKLKPGSIIKEIRANSKYGGTLYDFKIIKEGRLGLAKEEQEEKFNYLIDYLNNTGDIKSENKRTEATYIQTLLRDNKESYITAPASIKHHHNYVGGLLQHTIEVVNYLDIESETASIAAILHDFAKIYEYKIDLETGIITYNEEFKKQMMLEGSKIYPHILWAYNWCVQNGFMELAHIVASHHGPVEWGSIVKPATPEAHMLFIADYKSSHLGAITIDNLPEYAPF